MTNFKSPVILYDFFFFFKKGMSITLSTMAKDPPLAFSDSLTFQRVCAVFFLCIKADNPVD